MSITKKQYNNLALLEQYVRTVRSKQFDIRRWVDADKWKGAQDLSCGAPACLLGHATQIPEFELELAVYYDYFHQIHGFVRRCGSRSISSNVPYNEISRLFGDNAQHLFTPTHYTKNPWTNDGRGVTPKMAADAILDFLEKVEVVG